MQDRSFNRTLTLLESDARVADTDSEDQLNEWGRGGHIVVDVSAIADTPSIVVTVQGKDELSGNYYDILVSNAITATGTTILKIYPGIGVIDGAAASDVLPPIFRVSVAHGDADSITYSISAQMIG